MIERPLTAEDIVAVALLNHPCCDLRTCVCDTLCPCGRENECAYDNREHVERRLRGPTHEEMRRFLESPIVKAWLGQRAELILRAYEKAKG